MMNRVWRYMLAILSVTFFAGPAVAPADASSARTQAASVTSATGDKQNWDKVVAEAKKEGKVALYAIWSPKTRIALTEAFKAKYGIDTEFTPFSRGSDLLVKVQTEQRAGLYLADVFGAGLASLLVMKPTRVLGPIEPILLLPDVTDGNNWSLGKVTYIDKDKTGIAMISYLTRDAFFNTDLVKKGEITDYDDILKPQYKGKITMNDPTVTGAGATLIIHLAVNIWDLARARDYLTQLVGKQQVAIQRDNRLHVEEVARGKYPIGLAPNPDNFAKFLELGAHLDVVQFKQGVRATTAAGALAVPTKFAHPNAAKLFVNWLLTKEGQTVFSQSFGYPSLRKDVATKGFNPMFLPQSGEKVFPESEDFRRHTDEVMKMTKQVMDGASK